MTLSHRPSEFKIMKRMPDEERDDLVIDFENLVDAANG